MIDRTCCKCGEYVTHVWTYVLKDDKERIEWSGHENCISETEKQIKQVKNIDKKSVAKVIADAGLNK
jgi:hypothetical protein